ncbi:MAG: NifU family protein [Pseudomonadota bacterium]
MFIQTEETPNPATLKFIPGVEVMSSGTANFPTEEMAARSPLAAHLYTIDGVRGVFFGYDFISITKDDDKDWVVLKPALLGAIMEHFTAGRPLFVEDDAPAPSAPAADEGEDDEIVGQIKELLDTRVRPAVAQDGGDIIYHGFKEGVVYLHMQGACAGCPASTMTLKAGIENLMRHYIPEVQAVEAIN